jgi:hypothetical protein
MLRHGAAGDAAEYREESVMRRLLFLAVIVVLLGGAVALGSTAVAQSDPTPDAAGGTADTDGDGSEDYCLQDPAACDPPQDPDTDGDRYEDYCLQDRAACEPQRIMGESAFGEGATAELLAAGAIPAAPPQPAALALQRVRLAPGSRIVTPAGDPRVTLVYVERGTLTVRNTVDATVTRGAALATPGAQAQEAIPAETEFTMGAGDSSLSPAGTGGELRNDGTEEVRLLAGLIVPLPAGTPVP